MPIPGPTAIEDGFRHKIIYICEHGVARSGLPVIVAFTFRSGDNHASASSRHLVQRRVLLTTEHAW